MAAGFDLLRATSLIEVLELGVYAPLLSESKFGQDQWAVVEPPAILFCGARLEVRKGYVTDFASDPWWARWKFNPAGRHLLGAVFHDYLLDECELPRWQCDMILYLLLREAGTPSFEATVFWAAVRTRKRGPRGI